MTFYTHLGNDPHQIERLHHLVLQPVHDTQLIANPLEHRPMALPPEQINIKRRREEEPVETLCTRAVPVFFFPPRDVDPSKKYMI